MTVDIASEFNRYRESYGLYEQFANHARNLVELRLKLRRPKYQYLDVTCRPKEPVSLYRKLVSKIAQNSKTYMERGLDAIDDRVGVRVIVSTLEEAEAAVASICDLFEADPNDVDRKSLTNPANELRYLGIHVMSRLRTEDRGAVDPSLANMRFEVQVHTLSETAWAIISHPIVYKPFGDLSRDVASRVFRSVALVSLFDSEIDQALKLQQTSPEFAAVQMLKVVDSLFAPWRTVPTDDELSLLILDVCKDTYPQPFSATDFTELIETWVHDNTERLKVVLGQILGGPVEPLPTQPEILVLLERLSNARNKLRAVWVERRLDPEVLHRLAEATGDPYLS
jgi:ppGpp synthetase/RelA/SpoT-type nucleotidyltranferase